MPCMTPKIADSAFGLGLSLLFRPVFQRLGTASPSMWRHQGIRDGPPMEGEAVPSRRGQNETRMRARVPEVSPQFRVAHSEPGLVVLADLPEGLT